MNKSFFWPFAKEETKKSFLLFAKIFLVSDLIIGLGVATALTVLIANDPAALDPETPPGFSVTLFVTVLIQSWIYLSPLAFGFGALGVFWRFVGNWTLLPILLFPTLMISLFWAFSGFLSGQGHDILEAIRVAYQELGRPMSAGPAASHAGGVGGVLVFLLLLPKLLITASRVIFDPDVLWELSQYLAILLGLFFLGFFSSLVLSAVPVVKSCVRRWKERYRTFGESRSEAGNALAF